MRTIYNRVLSKNTKRKLWEQAGGDSKKFDQLKREYFKAFLDRLSEVESPHGERQDESKQ